ncbi:DUF11 domain-containing protein, partial [Bacteriovoracaceae bacterium]|nr:DUF11 domain-containing protein [Bacteriovoracaceae bacterium]
MKYYILLLAMLASCCLFGNPIKTIEHGSWDDPLVWENNLVPSINDAVEIRHRIELYETNANSNNGVLTHNGLVTISYYTTPANNGFGNEDGQLTIHTGATLKVTSGIPNQDSYLMYSANNDTPHVDHSLIGYNTGDLLESIPIAYQANFLASSSVIVKLKVGGVGYHQRGHLNIKPGGALETTGDLNIFGRANVYHGGKVNIGDDLNMIGDWSRLTVFQINCGDFLVGDDIFIDCLGRIDHQSFGTRVFLGQNSIDGTPETYSYLFSNTLTPQTVLDELSFESLIHYQDYLYHTPNPGNMPIESLLDISSNSGVVYTSGNPENTCNIQPDLSIVKESYSGQDELHQGGEWSYKITVKNNTYLSLTNIKILESEISNNFEIISVEPIGTYPLTWEPETNSNGAIVNYVSIPFIYPFGERKFKVTVKHDQNSCEAIINQVDIIDHSLFNLETNLTNNTSQVVTPLQGIDHLSLTGISVDQSEKSAVLKLKLTNLGSDQAQIVVTDLIEADTSSTIELIEVLTSGSNFSIINNEIEWTVNNLGFQEMAELTIRVDLEALNSYQEIKHSFQINEPSTLCNPIYGQGDVLIPFGTQEVDLSIEKTVISGYESTSLGEQIKYLIKVTNLSGTAATNVHIEDLIDPDLVATWSFGTPSLGIVENGLWKILVLPGNSFATIEVTSTTIENSCHDSVINIAQIINLDQIDIDSSNNMDQESVIVTGQVEISPHYEIVSYNNALRKVQVKFTVPNTTLVNFSDLKVEIDIPTEVDATVSSLNMGDFSNGNWTFANLAAG